MIRKGKMTLEEIAGCVSSLSFDELKEIEAEVMQLAINHINKILSFLICPEFVNWEIKQTKPDNK